MSSLIWKKEIACPEVAIQRLRNRTEIHACQINRSCINKILMISFLWQLSCEIRNFKPDSQSLFGVQITTDLPDTHLQYWYLSLGVQIFRKGNLLIFYKFCMFFRAEVSLFEFRKNWGVTFKVRMTTNNENLRVLSCNWSFVSCNRHLPKFTKIFSRRI